MFGIRQIILCAHDQLAAMVGIVDDAEDVARSRDEGETVRHAQQYIGDIGLFVEVHNSDNGDRKLFSEIFEWAKYGAHVAGTIAVNFTETQNAETGSIRIRFTLPISMFFLAASPNR